MISPPWKSTRGMKKQKASRRSTSQSRRSAADITMRAYLLLPIKDLPSGTRKQHLQVHTATAAVLVIQAMSADKFMLHSNGLRNGLTNTFVLKHVL